MSSARVTGGMWRFAYRLGVRARPLPASVLHHARGYGGHALVRVRAAPGAVGPRGDDGNRGAGTARAPRRGRDRRARGGRRVTRLRGRHRPRLRRRVQRASRASPPAPRSRGRAARGPDVVFATSPPLTIGLAGIAAARRWRVPLVFEVRDLWPEAPIQMGALRSPAAQRAARRPGARHLPRGGARGGTVAGHARRGDRGRRGPERVTLIPNASDLELFSPDVDPGDLRARLGLGDAFVASLLRHDGRGQRPDPGGGGRSAPARSRRGLGGLRAPGRRQAPRRAGGGRAAART